MIFATVGTDQPFDRMIKVVDSWASERSRNDVFAQIGEGGWKPLNIPYCQFLTPRDFKQRFEQAHVIIAHAGMGTILSALSHGKPILVMPKLARLGEHRNEHQLATARRMLGLANITVAFNEAELREKLDQIDTLIPLERIHPVATGLLIQRMRDFIFQDQSRHFLCSKNR